MLTEDAKKQLGKADTPLEKEMLEYIEPLADTTVCEKIIKNKLTLKGCWEYCHKSGKKFAVGNCAAIPPEQHFEWVRKYFGISEAPQSDKVIHLSAAKVSSNGPAVDFTDLF